MKYVAFILLLASLPSIGCSSLSSGLGFRDLVVFQDYAIDNRNKNEAYKAWKRAKWDYWRQGVPHYLREHIGRGFQQGFVDAAGGGGEELPYFPPRTYWGPAYQTPRGNEMIAAWFRGYSDGAMAGEQSGLAQYVTLPTSSAAPLPGSAESHAGEAAKQPFDFLPPDFLKGSEEVPKTPPVPLKMNEPLPPPGKLQPPPVPGKQTSAPTEGTKPSVMPAAPLLEAGAAAGQTDGKTRK